MLPIGGTSDEVKYEDLVKITIGDDPKKFFQVESQLPQQEREALEYVKKCDQCQRYAPSIHQLRGILNSLSSPWPFAQWGVDIVGPFPKAVGNKKYLLVGTDYFTKWVDVEPLANIRDVDVKRFV